MTFESTESSALPDIFLDLAQQLREFRIANSRFPVQCDAPTSAERGLGDYLRAQRRALTLYRRGDRAGTVAARVRYLDINVPGWRTENTKPGRRRTANTDFYERVNQCLQFVNRADGRRPRVDATDLDEQTLGRFLVNARQAKLGRGTMAWNSKRQATLDSALPGWDEVSPDKTFERRVGHLREFVAVNGRAPRRAQGRAADMSPSLRHETSLANLIGITKVRNPGRRQMLDEVLAAA